MMELIIGVIGTIPDNINSLTVTLDLIILEKYMVNRFKWCFLLLPLCYQGPIRRIELADPI